MSWKSLKSWIFCEKTVMDEFLKKYFSSTQNLKKSALAGDGGHRDYIRLRQGQKTFMLMSCGKHDRSLKKFVKIQKRLSPLVFTPKIFQTDYEQGLLLLEDLGDQSLEQLFLDRGKEAALPFYHQALFQLMEFQSKIDIQKTDPLFDKNFFKTENDMAISNLHTYINSSLKKPMLNQKSSEAFKKDMEKIMAEFKLEDYVFCHRDYHSRNLMLKKGRIAIIDFQDAGAGPWYYDLASLLYDCYVPLSPSYKKNLREFYFNNSPPALKKKIRSLSYIERMTKLQFLQRGFKACGRFSAFQNEDQKSTHLKYIPPTLELLKSTALEFSYRGVGEYLQRMTEALKELSTGGQL